MATPSSIPAVAGRPYLDAPKQPQRRRRRRHNEPQEVLGENNQAQDGSLALRPATIAPTTGLPSAEGSGTERPPPEIWRGPQQERTHRVKKPRGKQRADGADMNGTAAKSLGADKGPKRRFGGQLTIEAGPEAIQSQFTQALNGGAPIFQPGSTLEHTKATSRASSSAVPDQKRPVRARRQSKSNAPDLSSRIQEDISSGVYECVICYGSVLRNSKVWSCKKCWTVLHLHCVKKWANSDHALPTQPEADRLWRCPGCNLSQDERPTKYTCWCGKETDPRALPGSNPHSCGQSCGKARVTPKKCPHPCPLQCHAGPCDPCHHMGPTQECFCGKSSAKRRCLDTDYDNGWSCDAQCGRTMQCGEHRCPRSCHSGSCGECSAQIEGLCYCGQTERSLPCFEVKARGTSHETVTKDANPELREWRGLFDCGKPCQRKFDCGIHGCEKMCHVQDQDPKKCPRSPTEVKCCPCGKTDLQELISVPRESCEEEIPNCNKSCAKTLPCGHECEGVCHSGDCLPCLKMVSIPCRCGRTSNKTMCHQGVEEPPQCMRVCRATLNCSRHQCGERCCAGETKAIERNNSKKKQRQAGLDGIEAEHICTRICERPLKCGNQDHTCPQLCHKGACPSCLVSSSDDLACSCGRTVIRAPIRCGTPPPQCFFKCERPTTCGHPSVSHNCHGDEEACPKCHYLTSKRCACGKRILKNQPCYIQSPLCGLTCNSRLKCGVHTCQLTCHRPGLCEDSAKPCVQPCGRLKGCSHPCNQTCHSTSPCPENVPCTHRIRISCPCGITSTETRCSSTSSSQGNTGKTLSCTEECVRQARVRDLADALGIDRSTHSNNHIPYSADTLSFYSLNSPAWSSAQESLLRNFINEESRTRLAFAPMSSQRRAFVHALADDFQLDSESLDPEPHRHVEVFKPRTWNLSGLQWKTCAEAIKIREQEKRDGEIERATRWREQEGDKSYNAILLREVKFAAVEEEVKAAVAPTIGKEASVGSWEVVFLLSGEVVVAIRALSSTRTAEDGEKKIENVITALREPLLRALREKGVAKDVELVRVNESQNVVRRERQGESEEGGWSRVVSKGAAPSKMVESKGLGNGGGYVVLGRKKNGVLVGEEKGKKPTAPKKEEEVLEDWWDAAEELEVDSKDG